MSRLLPQSGIRRAKELRVGIRLIRDFTARRALTPPPMVRPPMALPEGWSRRRSQRRWRRRLVRARARLPSPSFDYFSIIEG